MHFNFHLDGHESPEKLRCIANAVLALGGLCKPSTQVGELTMAVSIDTSEASVALDKLASHPRVTLAEDGSVTVREVISLAHEAGVSKVEIPGAHGTTVIEVPPLATSAATVDASASSSALPVPTATFDAAGLPWDERIHSSSRATNADGKWRTKRGVSDTLVASVEAELRELLAGKALDDAAGAVLETMAAGAAKVHDAIFPPVPPLPPIPPAVPTTRGYPDVVELIISKGLSPETYVAIIGMSLPDFAKADPAAIDEAYGKLAAL